MFYFMLSEYYDNNLKLSIEILETVSEFLQ